MVKCSEHDLSRTFTALGDPTRRAMLVRLKQQPGLSVSELARPFSMGLPAVMKHLGVLADAGLVTRSKSGRTVSVHLAPVAMREAIQWLERHDHFWSTRLDRLANLVEDK